ncbi:MAG: oligoendopeptidase F [Halieaceae bacterium]|jgi:oligoendopeptidase F
MNAPEWDLSIAYAGLDDPQIETDIAFVCNKLLVLANWHGRSSEIEILQQAISAGERALIAAYNLAEYAGCLVAVNSADGPARRLSGQIDKLLSELTQAMEPFADALLRFDEADLNAVLGGSDASGPLERFRFEIMEQRKLRDSRLSVSEEQLLAAMSVDGRNAWGRLYDGLTGGLDVALELADGTEETVGISQAASILYGGDAQRRAPAWHGIRAQMETHSESIAAGLNALSGWRHSEHAKRSHTVDVHFLDPSLHASRIDRGTLDCLLQVAWDNVDVGRKAAKLMATVFGTEALEPWDQLAAMPAAAGESVPYYSFAEAIEIVRESFAGVNPEMGEFVQMMVERRWIDAAPQPRKQLGAFCSGFSAHRTPVVFMTWGNSMSDVLTLAHELGHAYHSWVMRDMPFSHSDYPMTLAETASIFAESVVRDALLKRAGSNYERRLMLWEELSAALGFLVNIPVRFEFERDFYQQRQGGELDVPALRQLMSETWTRWYGDSMTRADDMFWASKAHFSIADTSFYNYPYLFGYLFSLGVYAQRKERGADFFESYVAMLRSTGNMTAEEVAREHLGVDLGQPDFWLKSIDIARAQVNAFEDLL